MSNQFQYSFLRIPKTHSVDESAAQYRDLRLRALKASPVSFSSTFEIESQFTLKTWKDRILHEERENLVCVAAPTDPSASLQTQWVGQVTLRGPAKDQDFILPEIPGQSVLIGDEEEKWQMLSLFVLPEHQGQGLGQGLVREALRYLQERRQKPRVLVRLMIKAQNTATVRLYQKLGFEIVGKCTLAEALVANGDSDLIPRDVNNTKYTERTGLVMTLRLA
jgi:ribosomal protein S18 acetylase RimI-like enzyme